MREYTASERACQGCTNNEWGLGHHVSPQQCEATQYSEKFVSTCNTQVLQSIMAWHDQ